MNIKGPEGPVAFPDGLECLSPFCQTARLSGLCYRGDSSGDPGPGTDGSGPVHHQTVGSLLQRRRLWRSWRGDRRPGSSTSPGCGVSVTKETSLEILARGRRLGSSASPDCGVSVTEETPLEILARGQAARDLYRQVRRAGTVAVYRSRLFIIGNCRSAALNTDPGDLCVMTLRMRPMECPRIH